MSKKNTGTFSMLVGALAGAAAVFFSDKKNRQKAKQVIDQNKKKVVKLAKEAKANPEAFAKKTAKVVQAKVSQLQKQAATKKKVVSKKA